MIESLQATTDTKILS